MNVSNKFLAVAFAAIVSCCSSQAFADLVLLDFDAATITDSGGAASMNDLSLTNPVTASFGIGSPFEGLEVVVTASGSFTTSDLYNSGNERFQNNMADGNTNLFSFDFNQPIDFGVFMATNQINNAVPGDATADELNTLTIAGGAWDVNSFTYYDGSYLTPQSGVVTTPNTPVLTGSILEIGTQDTPQFLANDPSYPQTPDDATAQEWFVEGSGTGFDFQYELDDANGQNSFNIFVETDSVSAIPEPGSLSLIALATVGMLARRRR